MTFADASDGDVVLVSGVKWQLMSKMRGGWYCREDGTGPRIWFNDSDTIEEILVVNRERFIRDGKTTHDPLDRPEDQEPLLWKGTVK